MKKLLLILFLAVTSLHLQAQRKDVVEVPITPQPSPNLHVRLIYDKYRLIGDQQFTTKITNLTTKKIAVKGSLVATTVCGTGITSDFNVIIDPGKTEGGNAFIDDPNGMTGRVVDGDCPTKEELHPYPDDPKRTELNMIRRVALYIIESHFVDEEKPKAKEGLLSKIGDAMPDLSSNKPKTSQAANAQQAPKADPVAQAQTQELIKKAENPNNDAIMTQMYIGQAQANASRPGGATAEQKKAIADAQAQASAKNTADLAKSVGDLAGAIQNSHIKRSSSYDTEDINSGNFWLGAIGAYPANTAANFRQFGYGASMLAPLNFGDFQFMFDINYIAYQPASISTIASVVNQPAANLSNPTTGAEFSGTLGLGYCIIRKEGAVLVLQPAAGAISPGKFAVTNKNVTVSSDDSYVVGNMLTNANADFIFTYGGYLRFFTNNFGLSLGYMTNNTKTYNLSNNGANQIKANFDPGMLSFGITFRLL